ncbi:glycosyltransferase [Nocardia sp. NBC_01499]|uniref:glycosyltransferase n=1 Tax=Nocardia sp. NBC_01499 TaxID=2903597 RepID=UPI00386A84E2
MKSGCSDKISFCVTCKNRLWQLQQTLPANLEAILADGRSEIVLVNYNSDDDLDEWVRQFGEHIDSGVLRYIHEGTEQFFHCSKAKNLAHFAATGELLVNLDADNFIGDSIVSWRAVWAEHGDTVIQHRYENGSDGTYGRIGMPRAHFIALGGYDEQMHPVAVQDLDLVERGRASGLERRQLRQDGLAAIRNSVAEKIRYCGSDLSYKEMQAANLERMRDNLRRGDLVANRTRRPMKVTLNFVHEIEV